MIVGLDGDAGCVAVLGEQAILATLHGDSSGKGTFKPYGESFHECFQVALRLAIPGRIQIEITGKTAQSHAPVIPGNATVEAGWAFRGPQNDINV